MKKGKSNMNKIKISEELSFFIALIMIASATALSAAADFGVSMVVAPAYILSMKTPLTFGQSEYIIQAIFFILLCFCLKKFRFWYLFSFLTCIIYGMLLDFLRLIIPILNPDICPPGSFSLPARIIMAVCAVMLLCFSVAVFFRVYIYPQMYDFFVKMVSGRFNFRLRNFKYFFDFSCLCIAILLSLIFFGKIKGVGIYTVACTFINSFLINLFGRFIDRYFEFYIKYESFSKKFL